ncbi:Pr Domain Zinc Finger Protein 15 [Manis pentadactyla]|nr:Pr Domain Zinc Finger Protein 15 [Manis pentadactyla]
MCCWDPWQLSYILQGKARESRCLFMTMASSPSGLLDLQGRVLMRKKQEVIASRDEQPETGGRSELCSFHRTFHMPEMLHLRGFNCLPSAVPGVRREYAENLACFSMLYWSEFVHLITKRLENVAEADDSGPGFKLILTLARDQPLVLASKTEPWLQPEHILSFWCWSTKSSFRLIPKLDLRMTPGPDLGQNGDLDWHQPKSLIGARKLAQNYLRVEDTLFGL